MFSQLFPQLHKTCIKWNMSIGYRYFAVLLGFVCVHSYTTECTAEDLPKSRHLLGHDLNNLTTALARLPQKSQKDLCACAPLCVWVCMHTPTSRNANIQMWGTDGRGCPKNATWVHRRTKKTGLKAEKATESQKNKWEGKEWDRICWENK